ncbi:MAG: TetR/AcrR family transcriptional regulator [Hyphomicrobiales bacterium]|nr:TetR/AcrR family transcriptional regulator [Hyphomicrobiales bacterium]
MPYPSGHRDMTRATIIRVARRLFNRFGFDGVSVGQIMAEAGLTHGGFYRHFRSKSDLYAEALQCFFTDPGWDNNWEGIEIDRDAADIGPQIVRAYLSRQHFESIENSCPMVALPSDVARNGESAKRAYETVFRAMVDILQNGSRANQHPDRTAALAIAALCVGGMVIARASEDRGLADQVRDACTEVALRLGGWDEGRDRARPRRRPL